MGAQTICTVKKYRPKDPENRQFVETRPITSEGGIDWYVTNGQVGIGSTRQDYQKQGPAIRFLHGVLTTDQPLVVTPTTAEVYRYQTQIEGGSVADLVRLFRENEQIFAHVEFVKGTSEPLPVLVFSKKIPASEYHTPHTSTSVVYTDRPDKKGVDMMVRDMLDL